MSNWPFNSSFSLLAILTKACHIFDTDALAMVLDFADDDEAPFFVVDCCFCFFTDDDDDGFFVLVVPFEDVFFAAMVRK